MIACSLKEFSTLNLVNDGIYIVLTKSNFCVFKGTWYTLSLKTVIFYVLSDIFINSRSMKNSHDGP